MQRTSVQSATMVSVGYEAASATLELELSSGDVMQFYNVPLSVYIAFAKAASKAASKGDYYHQNIKAQYESKQVTESTVNKNNDAAPSPVYN